jgi:hypothetical protein
MAAGLGVRAQMSSVAPSSSDVGEMDQLSWIRSSQCASDRHLRQHIVSHAELRNRSPAVCLDAAHGSR